MPPFCLSKIILFNIAPRFAYVVLMINHQSFQENFGILPRPAHGRFLPDRFRVIATFHVEYCWVTNSCREVTHTKVRGGVELWLKSFLTWVRYRGEWPASRPDHFIPWKQLRLSLYRRLCGPLSRSGRFGIERNLLLGFEPRSIHQYTYWDIPLSDNILYTCNIFCSVLKPD